MPRRVAILCPYYLSPCIKGSLAFAFATHLILSSLPGQIWDGGAGNGNWNAANNWNPNSVPANNGTAAVTFAGNTQLSVTVDSGGWNRRLASLTFASGAGAFSFNGGRLDLGSGGILHQATSTQTLNSQLLLEANQTWTAASTGAIVTGGANFNADGYSLTLAGSGSISLGGSVGNLNNLTLSGSGARSFAAAISTDGALVSTSSGSVTFSGPVSGAGGVQLGGTGSYAAASTVASSGGNIVVSAGAPSTFAGNVTANNGSVTVSASGSTTFGGNVTGRSGVSFTGSGDSIVAGYLASQNGSVALSGAGDVVVTAGVNSAGGGVSVSGSGDRSFGAAVNTSAGVSVTGSGSTSFSGSINAASSAVTLGGSGAITLSGAQVNSGSLVINGSGSVVSASQLNLGGGNLTLSGSGSTSLTGSAINVGNVVVSGSGDTTLGTQINASGSFTQTGSGTTTFSGNGTNYFSSVSITGGEVVLDQTGGYALQVSGGNVAITGATVSFGGDNQVANWNDVTLGAGSVLLLNDTVQDIDQLIITGNSILDFGSGGSTLDVGGLTLVGDSVLTIANWNTSADLFFANINPGSSTLAKVVFEGLGEAAWQPGGGGGMLVPVPEPAAFGLLALGGLGAFGLVRRPRR